MGINRGNLRQNEVHLWQVSLQSFPLDFQQSPLFGYLSEDERLRAERYVHQSERTRFVVARGILRVLLGDYLAINPGAIVFEYGAHGKPILTSELLKNGLNFNVSHAGDEVMYIFARDRQVGIDIERIRDNIDINGIAERFFSVSEYAALRRIAPEHQLTAFFNTWARKEAFIKAIGAGLFYELKHFDVSVDLNEPAALLAIEGEPQKAKAWSLQAFSPGEGYVGAWVMEGAIEHVRYERVRSELLCD